MSEDGLIISMGEDGVWGIHEEPYMTIAIATEEEFNLMNELLELGKQYKEKLKKESADNE